jgi:hypothetical protein
MTRDHVAAFVARDWQRLARSKAAAWRAARHNRTTAELLAAADTLRRHARAVKPDWPTAADRAADLATHQRVSEALGAVTRRPR